MVNQNLSSQKEGTGQATADEIEAAAVKGFIPVHLGKSRLRTETAGVAACHSVYFINQ